MPSIEWQKWLLKYFDARKLFLLVCCFSVISYTENMTNADTLPSLIQFIEHHFPDEPPESTFHQSIFSCLLLLFVVLYFILLHCIVYIAKNIGGFGIFVCAPHVEFGFVVHRSVADNKWTLQQIPTEMNKCLTRYLRENKSSIFPSSPLCQYRPNVRHWHLYQCSQTHKLIE